MVSLACASCMQQGYVDRSDLGKLGRPLLGRKKEGRPMGGRWLMKVRPFVVCLRSHDVCTNVWHEVQKTCMPVMDSVTTDARTHFHHKDTATYSVISISVYKRESMVALQCGSGASRPYCKAASRSMSTATHPVGQNAFIAWTATCVGCMHTSVRLVSSS